MKDYFDRIISGAIIGGSLGFFGCISSCVSDSENFDFGIGFGFLFWGVVFGVVISIIVTYAQNKEFQEEQERQRILSIEEQERQRILKEKQDKKEKIGLERDAEINRCNIGFSDIFVKKPQDQLSDIDEVIRCLDNANGMYRDIWEQGLKKYQGNLISEYKQLLESSGYAGLEGSIKRLELLKSIGHLGYDKAIQEIKNMISLANANRVIFMKKDYGIADDIIIKKINKIDHNGWKRSTLDYSFMQFLWYGALRPHALRCQTQVLINELANLTCINKFSKDNHSATSSIDKGIWCIDALAAEMYINKGRVIPFKLENNLLQWIDYQLEHKNYVRIFGLASFCNWADLTEFELRIVKSLADVNNPKRAFAINRLNEIS